MLNALIINNGQIKLDFDPLVNLYTVNISEDIFSLEIDYIVKGEYEVRVTGNDNLFPGENNIYVDLIDSEDNVIRYMIIANKEESVGAFNESNNAVSLSVPIEENTPAYIAPLLSVSIVIILYVLFKVLFCRKKKGLKN